MTAKLRHVSCLVLMLFKAKSLSHDDLVDIIFSKDKGRGEAFWQEISEFICLILLNTKFM